MKKIIIFIAGLAILGLGIYLGLNIKTMIENHKNNSDVPTINNSIDNIEDKVNIINTVKDKVNEINDTVKKDNENYNNILDDINTTPAPTTNVEYSSTDNEVINTLSETLENIKNSEVTESFKVNAKKTFIDVVDFIFYGGTIKGHTFEELTNSGKEKVLELASKIDEAIESKVPNYKESISNGATKAFKEASNLIKKGSNNLNNFLQSKLSEESYNAIINSKDDLVYYSKNAVSFIKDNAPKLFNTVKEKLSEWYSRYKNS